MRPARAPAPTDSAPSRRRAIRSQPLRVGRRGGSRRRCAVGPAQLPPSSFPVAVAASPRRRSCSAAAVGPRCSAGSGAGCGSSVDSLDDLGRRPSRRRVRFRGRRRLVLASAAVARPRRPRRSPPSVGVAGLGRADRLAALGRLPHELAVGAFDPLALGVRRRPTPLPASWVSLLMSTRQPVSRAARRAFWPSLPIASDSWKSGTITSAMPVSSWMRTSRTFAGASACITNSGGFGAVRERCRPSRRAARSRPDARACRARRRTRRPGRRSGRSTRPRASCGDRARARPP